MKIEDIKESYGLFDESYLNNISASVCDCLGYGVNGKADLLIYEICGAETGFCTIEDKTLGAGNGAFQHDKIPFEDNQSRYKQNDIIKIIDSFSINMEHIVWEDLKTDILIGAIATRLHFKPFKEEIPKDIVGRARYWKRYYNTEAGAGTVKHYLEMNGFDMDYYHSSMEVEF